MENLPKDRSSPIATLRRLFLLLSDTQFEAEIAVERLRRATLKKAPIVNRKRPPPPNNNDNNAEKAHLHDDDSSSTSKTNNDTADDGTANPDNKKLKTNSVSRVTLPLATTTAKEKNDNAAVVIAAAAGTTTPASTVPPLSNKNNMPPVSTKQPPTVAKNATTAAAYAAPSDAFMLLPDHGIVHQRWEYNFQALQAFERKYGHVNVPSVKDSEYSRLYEWLRNQRRHWKKQIRGEKNHLTEQQINQLIRIGVGTREKGPSCISKEIETARWTVRFQELLLFKEEHGHCDVSDCLHRDTHLPLAHWVQAQRKNYWNRQHAEAIARGELKRKPGAFMNDDQYEQLQKIGFRFSSLRVFQQR